MQMLISLSLSLSFSLTQRNNAVGRIPLRDMKRKLWFVHTKSSCCRGFTRLLKKKAEGKKRGELGEMERILGKCSRLNGKRPIVKKRIKIRLDFNSGNNGAIEIFSKIRTRIKDVSIEWLRLFSHISNLPGRSPRSSRAGKVFISLDLWGASQKMKRSGWWVLKEGWREQPTGRWDGGRTGLERRSRWWQWLSVRGGRRRKAGLGDGGWAYRRYMRISIKGGSNGEGDSRGDGWSAPPWSREPPIKSDMKGWTCRQRAGASACLWNWLWTCNQHRVPPPHTHHPEVSGRASALLLWFVFAKIAALSACFCLSLPPLLSRSSHIFQTSFCHLLLACFHG